MTEILTWAVFAAIPVLLVVGELRAARKRKQDAAKPDTKIENLAIALGFAGAAVAWSQHLGGVA